jgi:exodeoxyribonuclease V alpha subunit
MPHDAADTVELDDGQQHAVELTCAASIGIVTGGPGTGKSTCLRYALDELDRCRKTYELAAPTGKAAKRVQETTGRNARTIHRLLGFNPREGWKHNRHNPIQADAVIVDESSMIDIELAAALLDAINPNRTRLILIGDANQLPPVGPGRLFGDLVDAAAVPIVRLLKLHRSAQRSWVAVNAPKILVGEKLDLKPHDDFQFIEIGDAVDILPRIKRLHLDPANADLVGRLQVLIPQRPGVAGIEAANRMLQDAMNPRQPSKPALARDKFELRLNDRVIQTRNDYLLGVFNGEVGEVVDIAEGKVHVLFDGEIKSYSFEQAGALQHAYALTVHRSQGSEFPWVLVVCHSTHTFILSRQLLYTGITRAKKGVILVGDEKGIARALSDARPPKRNTALIERLRKEG